MALVLKDRVRETTTVLGTNDAVLLGAVTGFQSFAVVGSANTCYYCIADQAGANWEVGIGTYSSVGPTLVRTTILSSSNSGSIVSFPAGTKDVFLTYPSEKAVFEDASGNVSLPADLTVVGAVNAGSINATTIDLTNIEVTNIKAKDGTQSIALADSTGVATLSANPILNAGTANGVLYLNGSKVATSGSALTFDGTNLGIGTSSPVANARLTLSDTNTFKAILTGGTTQNAIKLDSVGAANAYYVGAGNSLLQGGDKGFMVYDLTNSRAKIYCDDGTGETRVLGTTYQTVYTNNTERMRIDSSGNLGLGVTPSAWASSWKVLQVGATASFSDNNLGDLYLASNWRFDGTGDKYITNNYANLYRQENGAHSWLNAPSGTAGAAISFTQVMTLDASGNLGLGATPSAWSAVRGFDITAGGGFGGSTGGAYVAQNCYFNGTNWIYKTSSGVGASYYASELGSHKWFIAPNGTAGNPITLTQAMTLNASGNLGIGTSSPGGRLDVLSADDSVMYMRNTSAVLRFRPYVTSLNAGQIACLNSGLAAYAQLNISGNPLVFEANGTERMRIDSAGNVGIGDTSPSVKLTVAQGKGTDYGKVLKLVTAASLGAGTDGPQIHFINSGVAQWGMGMPAGDSSAFAWFSDGSDLGVGTERMRIDSSGNVGIGVTSPIGRLHVNSATESAVRITSDLTGVTSTDGMFFGLNTNGTDATLWNYENGYLRFATNGTERMRITSNGYLLVGTPNTSATATNRIIGQSTGALLALVVEHNAADAGVRGIGSVCPNYSGNDGYLFIGNAGGVDKFYVRTSGNVQNSNNSYGAISDATLKENIVDATPKLADLLKVRIRNYNLIEDESKTKQIGVVAQELEEVFPGLVETYTPPEGDEQIKSVKYSVFVPMLIKAIQEQQDQINQLKAEVAALKGA